jgi:hypothetical protein
VHAKLGPDIKEDVAASVGKFCGPPPAASFHVSLLHFLPSHLTGGRSIGIDNRQSRMAAARTVNERLQSTTDRTAVIVGQP